MFNVISSFQVSVTDTNGYFRTPTGYIFGPNSAQPDGKAPASLSLTQGEYTFQVAKRTTVQLQYINSKGEIVDTGTMDAAIGLPLSFLYPVSFSSPKGYQLAGNNMQPGGKDPNTLIVKENEPISLRVLDGTWVNLQVPVTYIDDDTGSTVGTRTISFSSGTTVGSIDVPDGYALTPAAQAQFPMTITTEQPLSFRVYDTKTRTTIRYVDAAGNTLKNAVIKDRSDGTVDVSQAVPAGYHLSSKQSAILKHNDNGWNVLVTDRDDSSGSTVIINPGNNGSGNTTNPIQNPEGTDFSGVAVITNSDGATIYSNANTTQATNRTLANGTKWQNFGVRKVQGDTLAYNLGGSQWVKASDVLIAGGSNNNNPSTNTNQSSEVKTSGTFVVRVPDHPTWATVLWNHDATQHGELLKAGSAWKVYASKQINGKTYYRLGTNEQWVRAEYGYLK